MASVCQAIMIHVYPCIVTLLELISIQVMASGTDSGLVLLIPWHKGGSISSFQGHWWNGCHFMRFSKFDPFSSAESVHSIG
jgi:hypothetical protein